MFNRTRLVLSFICPFAYDSGFNQELVFLSRVNVGFADVVIHSCLVPLWDRVRVITRVNLKEVSAKKKGGNSDNNYTGPTGKPGDRLWQTGKCDHHHFNQFIGDQICEISLRLTGSTQSN